MQKILFIDSVHPLIRERLSARGFCCDYFPDYHREEYKRIIGDYEGLIIRSKIILDKEILQKAKRLKFIGRVGSGMENIDVEYAKSRNICCLNSPEGNRDAVGEHTLGMLLALLNHLPRADRQVRQGLWKREENRGREIKGKTICIIGYGNMGSAFAQRLRGFEAEVLSYDKYKTDYANEFVRESTLEEVFESCDILSLHVPLTRETHYLVNHSFLQHFRKSVILINTSRGNVVNTADLVRNMKSGKVIGAALDVLEYEDTTLEAMAERLPEDFQYLVQSENVILSPHIAGWTVESNIRLAEVLVQKILDL